MFFISFLNYLIVFLFFLVILYFYGRGIMLLINFLIYNSRNIPKNLLRTKKINLYPILGTLYIGNLLIITNYFLPLKSPYVYPILLVAFLPNFLKIEKINLNFDYEKILGYLIIPSILIVSIYNTGWHYDAGYYHLNHQHWLRESNMVIGMVNIHWAFGMSSISEYISSILWINNSFVLLHFLNLSYIFCFYNILLNDLHDKNRVLQNGSFFLIIFSLLDNLGIYGGRNGFLFIEGVPKQDTTVAILFFLIARSIFLILNDKKIIKFEVTILSLLVLFVIQIKLSSVVLALLIFLLYWFLIIKKGNSFLNLLYINIPSIVFSLFWIFKQYLTTGCFIYPVNSTCINSFNWYIKNSTESYELITRNSSYALSLYDFNFSKWSQEFLSFKINFGVTINSVGSLLLILLASKVFYYNSSVSKKLKIILSAFLILNLVYLIYYGPTPRYLMGYLIFSAYIVGLFSEDARYFKPNRVAKNTLILLSVILLIRSTSYVSMLNNNNIELFDPRPIAEYVIQENGWLKPDLGDQCWIKLRCTMSTHKLIIDEDNFFKIAYRE